jgi:hypothetical protein
MDSREVATSCSGNDSQGLSITGNDLGMDSLDPFNVSCDPGNNCARGSND